MTIIALTTDEAWLPLYSVKYTQLGGGLVMMFFSSCRFP